MDRGPWRATVHGVAKRSYMTEYIFIITTPVMFLFLKSGTFMACNVTTHPTTAQQSHMLEP